MKYFLLTIFPVCLFFSKSKPQNLPAKLFSPDKKLHFTLVTTPENDELIFSVKYNDKPVIAESSLGITFNGEVWDKHFVFKEKTWSYIDFVRICHR